MLTADERIALIWPKVERAKKHVLEFKGAIDAFRESKPQAIGTKRNPQTRQLIYYVSRAEPVPPSIAAIAGDVVQNLRTALDYLHQHLLMVGTGSDTPRKGKDATFYIDGDPNPNHYKTSAPAKVQGLRQDAIDALKRIEPYKGGKGHDLWILNELNNIDKHRALVIVASAYRSMSIWPVIQRMMDQIPGTAKLPDEASDAMHKASFIRPADRKCPLKVGDELFIDAPDAEPNEKIQFAFDVAINELQVVEAEPALETLQQLTDLVGGMVMAFRPCLA